MDNLEIINSLLDQVGGLNLDDYNSLDILHRRTEMIARNLFGQDCKYLRDIGNIRYVPSYSPASREEIQNKRAEGISRLHNIIKTMKEEVQLFQKEINNKHPDDLDKNYDTQIFIVHGHDRTMKETVARTIEKLLLEPIILHEQPNEGRTIIEKIIDFANVGYAIVLLSPDDLTYERGMSPENASYRARQNVIFELGFFIGKLGRDRVIALYQQQDKFEMPSDYSGVLYAPFDEAGRWQFDLVRELRAKGYNVDANALLK